MRKEDTIVGFVQERLQEKDKVFELRMNVLEYQSTVLRKLINISSQKPDGQSSSYGYGSGIYHKIENFCTASKLAPTFNSFKHEQTRVGEDLIVQAENISDLHLLMRKRGNYQGASQNAALDLVRGESFIRRYIKKNKAGEPLCMAYEAVPFDEMRWKYQSDTDVIRVKNISKDDVIVLFGEKIAEKAKPSVIYSKPQWNYRTNQTINTQQREEQVYTYIHYVVIFLLLMHIQSHMFLVKLIFLCVVIGNQVVDLHLLHLRLG
jgi:hypothetical protein